jgi:uncharacterized protein
MSDLAEAPVKVLVALFDDTDRWHEMPLHEAVVRELERHGVAGATVLTGIMGYGSHRRIHRKGLFGVVDDKPVVVVAVDEEANLREALPKVRSMVREGLVLLLDGVAMA